MTPYQVVESFTDDRSYTSNDIELHDFRSAFRDVQHTGNKSIHNRLGNRIHEPCHSDCAGGNFDGRQCRSQRKPSGHRIHISAPYISDDRYNLTSSVFEGFPDRPDTINASSTQLETDIANFEEDDMRAAEMVEVNMKRAGNDSEKQELRNYINGQLPLGADDLNEIRRLADGVWFNGTLKGKVNWRWSDNESLFNHQYLAATATRCAKAGGRDVETQIILSTPLLRQGDFDRRLLISAWLHELVHSYLFIQCGMIAVAKGGHTAGFQKIGALIDEWTGHGQLHLKETKADLKKFLRMPKRRYHGPLDDPIQITGATRRHRIQKQWRRDDRRRTPRISPQHPKVYRSDIGIFDDTSHQDQELFLQGGRAVEACG